MTGVIWHVPLKSGADQVHLQRIWPMVLRSVVLGKVPAKTLKHHTVTALSLIRLLYLAASMMILMSSFHQQLQHQPLPQLMPDPLPQQ